MALKADKELKKKETMLGKRRDKNDQKDTEVFIGQDDQDALLEYMEHDQQAEMR